MYFLDIFANPTAKGKQGVNEHILSVLFNFMQYTNYKILDDDDDDDDDDDGTRSCVMRIMSRALLQDATCLNMSLHRMLLLC